MEYSEPSDGAPARCRSPRVHTHGPWVCPSRSCNVGCELVSRWLPCSWTHACSPGQRPLPGPRRGRGTSWVRVSLSHSGKSECASREPSLPVSLADPASSQSYVLLLKSPEGARPRARCGPVAAASRRPARGRPHRSEEACPPALLCL